MAFNPFKNRVISEPDIEEQVSNNTVNHHNFDDDIVTYEIIKPNISDSELYDGEKITDLQETGLKTEELLNKDIPQQVDKQKFNLPLLESLSLIFVLEQLGAEKVKDNMYKLYDQDISIKDNKWYNTTLKTGRVNAISLVKHLFAIKDKLNEKDNQKTLFLVACRYLNDIQNIQPDIVEKAVEQITTPVVNNLNNKPHFRSNEQNSLYWQELTEQLNNISLNLVMEHIGANPNEDKQKGKWKVWSTGDNVAITGQQWHSWKSQKGGFGAISLLAFHLSIVNNIDDRIEEQRKIVRKMAIKELIQVFGDGDLSMIADSGENLVFKQPFAMPHIIDFKINHVRHYLNEKRGLPLWIIDKQIKAGLLFAGFPSDWKAPKFLKDENKLTDDNVWATFLSANGTAAEMRAIERTDNFAKILAKGSDKDLGGFLLKAEKEVSEKTVSVLEASIDAMSYHAFFPGRIATSCMGVNFNLAVKAAIETLDRNYNFQFAFDNDQAGNEASIRFREELINELGEQEYNEHYLAGRINYYDLGLRCLEESLLTNKIFYLDVQDNQVGRDVVNLFQEQAMKKFGKESVKSIVAKGYVKYINVCPTFEIINDVQKEALAVFTKLTSGKPYYLRITDKDDTDNDENKQHGKEKKEAFILAFKNIAGEKYLELEKNGSIIYNKSAIAKDWNEYFIYRKTNNPDFKESLHEQENKYAHYSKKEDVKNIKKKGRKM